MLVPGPGPEPLLQELLLGILRLVDKLGPRRGCLRIRNLTLFFPFLSL
jgi:hypothetical protein